MPFLHSSFAAFPLGGKLRRSSPFPALAGRLPPVVPIMLVVLIASTVDASEPNDRPQGSATRLEQTPTLDGLVADDPAWRGVTPFTGFRQLRPDTGAAASERTEVYFGFTDDTLHVGVICHESDPDAITVSNDGTQSDSFSMVLDTHGTGLAGMVFGTNPVGAEYDGQVADEFADWNWSTVWEVRSVVGEHGWSAELAIPFDSLRYGDGEVQSWRVNFARVIRRNNEIAYWAPVPRQFSMFRLSLAGTIDGIRVPPQRRELKITPYGLVGIARRGTRDGSRRTEDAGFDVKYSITPSLTLDITYNTDFAQVESDAQQVNLGRFSLFFPETRPFFLENANAFAVGIPGMAQVFHSRRIGIAPDGRRLPIDGGVRLSGKVGSATNVGLLHMRVADVPGEADEGNDFTVARLSRDLPNRSSIGFIATDRRRSGSDGQTYGVDGSLGLGANTQVRAFAARSSTPGLDDEYAASVYGSYKSSTWNTDASYTEVGAGFNPEVGFVGRREYRAVQLYAERNFVDEKTLNEWRPLVIYRSHWDFDGFHESGNLHLESWYIWKSGADVWPAVNFSHEGVKEPFTIAGVVVPAGNYRNRDFEMGMSSASNRKWSGGTHLVAGGFYNGKRFGFAPFVNYRRDETFNAWASLGHNTIDLGSEDGAFSVNVVHAGLSYSFTPRVRLGTFLQYNDDADVISANVRFSWLRSASAGLYVVYNEIDARNGLGEPRRELVLKYSHIFDVL